MSKVYLIIGVPGSGKTWVMSQLRDKQGCICIENDNYIGHPGERLNSIEYAVSNGLTVFTDTPFSINEILVPLQERKLRVEPVFIIEKPEVIMERYKSRAKKALPKGNLTRLETYKERAAIMKAFQGTSQQVLEYLKKV